MLPNGKVLVAGGINDQRRSRSAELYDPATGTWTATGSLATARYGHTATLLPNGKVLVAGGRDISGAYLASAELYDPASGTWTATGSLATARFTHGDVAAQRQGARRGRISTASTSRSRARNSTTRRAGPGLPPAASPPRAIDHTATLLPNGKVLVAGGYNDSGMLASAELYDPASGTWTATGSLATARDVTRRRCCPTARCSSRGAWLTAQLLRSAELYDPASGTWSATGSLATARYYHTATLLPNGKVLVAGGHRQRRRLLASAELYDPASGTWSATGSLVTARYCHTATLLPNGKVLVAGGS